MDPSSALPAPPAPEPYPSSQPLSDRSSQLFCSDGPQSASDNGIPPSSDRVTPQYQSDRSQSSPSDHPSEQPSTDNSDSASRASDRLQVTTYPPTTPTPLVAGIRQGARRVGRRPLAGTRLHTVQVALSPPAADPSADAAPSDATQPSAASDSEATASRYRSSSGFPSGSESGAESEPTAPAAPSATKGPAQESYESDDPLSAAEGPQSLATSSSDSERPAVDVSPFSSPRKRRRGPTKNPQPLDKPRKSSGHRTPPQPPREFLPDHRVGWSAKRYSQHTYLMAKKSLHGNRRPFRTPEDFAKGRKIIEEYERRHAEEGQSKQGAGGSTDKENATPSRT